MLPPSVTLRVVMARPEVKGARLQTNPFAAVRACLQFIPEQFHYSRDRTFPSISLFCLGSGPVIFFSVAWLRSIQNGLNGHMAMTSLET